MSGNNKSVITIHNASAILQVELNGGAVVDFHLTANEVNPLSFRFSKEQMPERNRSGAVYQGHFLCLGRWGEPSPGEKLAGMPDHGRFANQLWDYSDGNDFSLHMQAESVQEGLSIMRSMTIDQKDPVFVCSETVTNCTSIGRIYNMVQHPTIAAPFLQPSTRIFCNATRGFHFNHYDDSISGYTSNWPLALLEDGTETDMRSCESSKTSVHSYIVDPDKAWGWIAANSPHEKLILGYLWRRSDYPWINLWRDYLEDKIRYRGLEFGTTGVHQPFPEIMKARCYELFGEKVFDFLDAGSSITRTYYSFLWQTPKPVSEITAMTIENGQVRIDTDQGSGFINLPSTFF